MTDERPEPQIYLTTPKLRESAAFANQLEAALEAAPVACLLIEIDPASLGDAKRIIRELTPLAQRFGAAVLIRDPALAARAGADGVHLSADDPQFPKALDDAVADLKPDRIVGLGAVRSRHEAMSAGERGVDYVMFGDPGADDAPAPSEETLAFVGWWCEIFTVPCVAYAADPADAPALIAAGADFVAFGPAIWNDPSGPAQILQDAMRRPVIKVDAR